MKPLFSALLLSTAFAAPADITGTYNYNHEIAFLSYADEASCVESKGRWQDDLCIFDDNNDTVEISAAADGKYQLRVSTITTNAHMCDYEGEGKLVGGKLLSSQAVDVWQEGKTVPGTCEVTVNFPEPNVANVEATEPCQSLCGMRATLNIDRAERSPGS